ncbi:hypothetical protein [Actinokineospora sp. HUAS TT18]|uniref:hypothetical protein n=1 Tax=Actinokineospora sp. HUAS TT18 TaxID=3447451 RepID=UPI003F51D3FB
MDELDPVLGPPPQAPDEVWSRVLAAALDPAAPPADSSIVPVDPDDYLEPDTYTADLIDVDEPDWWTDEPEVD